MAGRACAGRAAGRAGNRGDPPRNGVTVAFRVRYDLFARTVRTVDQRYYGNDRY